MKIKDCYIIKNGAYIIVPEDRKFLIYYKPISEQYLVSVKYEIDLESPHKPILTTVPEKVLKDFECPLFEIKCLKNIVNVDKDDYNMIRNTKLFIY